MAPPKTKDTPRPHAEMGARIRAGRKALRPADDSPESDLRKLEQFSIAVGLTANHVTRIERGEVMPHDRKLARISNTLGLVQHWLCTGKGRKRLRAGESNPVEGCSGGETQ